MVCFGIQKNTEVLSIRKVLCLTLVIFSLLSINSLAAPVQVEGFTVPVDVTINGDFVKCISKPYSDNGVTYIPLRSFADFISAPITWNDDEASASFTKNGVTFVFYSDQPLCLVNGYVCTDGYAQMQNDEIMFIPLYFVCNYLGYSVSWDSFYYIEDVVAPDVVSPVDCADFSYTRNDLYWLAKICHIECGGESVRTRIGIANTVVNRVRSPLYPNNIPAAITDVNHGVQYPPAHTARFKTLVPDSNSMIAAKCALNGVELVGDSVAFVHVNAYARSWAANNMRHYTTIGVVGFFCF